VPFDDNTIGRGDDAPIRIRDRAVSRSHARLFRTSRTWFIEPVTSSMNGAYVNGLLLKKSKALRTGDTIELGHTVLRFDEPERAPEECTKVERKDPMPLPMAAEPSVKLEAPVEVTTPLAMAPKQPLVSLELMLMSAGAALAVLGMGAVALVFR
jgi:pSer/pThr/pTyr-binding forkhead associated (FHA) protein